MQFAFSLSFHRRWNRYRETQCLVSSEFRPISSLHEPLPLSCTCGSRGIFWTSGSQPCFYLHIICLPMFAQQLLPRFPQGFFTRKVERRPYLYPQPSARGTCQIQWRKSVWLERSSSEILKPSPGHLRITDSIKLIDTGQGHIIFFLPT